MIVKKIEFDGFRNLKAGMIEPGSGVNIIYGNNAQGKTNLLEAIWLFTGSRSFRGATDTEMIRFKKERALLSIEFNAWERDQKAKISFNDKKTVNLNGLDVGVSKLVGNFCAMVFSPSHLSLIKDGPNERRRFIDNAYCQIRPAFVKILSNFNRTLTQRNALLRQMKKLNSKDKSQLLIWNETFARSGAQIVLARSAYVRKIAPLARDIYFGFSKNKEVMSLRYETFAKDDIKESYEKDSVSWLNNEQEIYLKLLKLLEDNAENDLAAGFTTEGPHRDDLEILISGLSARIYSSQGQQRSSVLSLKLAEASLLKEVTKEQPIALLDDVMSELDVSRQDYILNHIEGWQVFITCCDPTPIMRLSKGKTFNVNDGVVEFSEVFK